MTLGSTRLAPRRACRGTLQRDFLRLRALASADSSPELKVDMLPSMLVGTSKLVFAVRTCFSLVGAEDEREWHQDLMEIDDRAQSTDGRSRLKPDHHGVRQWWLRGHATILICNCGDSCQLLSRVHRCWYVRRCALCSRSPVRTLPFLADDPCRAAPAYNAGRPDVGIWTTHTVPIKQLVKDGLLLHRIQNGFHLKYSSDVRAGLNIQLKNIRWEYVVE